MSSCWQDPSSPLIGAEGLSLEGVSTLFDGPLEAPVTVENDHFDTKIALKDPGVVIELV